MAKWSITIRSKNNVLSKYPEIYHTSEDTPTLQELVGLIPLGSIKSCVLEIKNESEPAGF